MQTEGLVPGQYQIGSLVMGPFTPFKIEAIDIGNYDVNIQDHQAQMSNEIRFGSDTLKPAPLQLTINVMVNRALPHIAGLTSDTRVLDFSNDPNLADLQREWRAEDVMQQWGAIKPLLFCGSDGVTRQFYGRPGKFAYQKHRQIDSNYYICQAEFRRSDTFAYSNTQYYVDFQPNSPQTLTRVNGNADSWVMFRITGPVNRPIINWGSRQIELNRNIPAGSTVEISSYPWQRRVVNNQGISLAAYIVTDRPYLDTIRFPFNRPHTVSWHGTGTTSSSRMRVLWHDAYQVMD